MKKKVLIWNINQRCNCGKADTIPAIVAASVSNQADIIILTEFYKTTKWIEELGEKMTSYNIFVSDNPTNQILIAVKMDTSIKRIYSWKSSYDEDRPDYLEVVIEENEIKIAVVGVRILVGRYNYEIPNEVNNVMQNRKKQCDNFINRITQLKKDGYLIIGGGDFNTGRRCNSNHYWNKEIIKEALSPNEIKLVTPVGCSHGLYKGENAGCPDHLMHSEEITVQCKAYDWSFVRSDYIIYHEAEFTKKIDPPYPDHAMIKAEFSI